MHLPYNVLFYNQETRKSVVDFSKYEIVFTSYETLRSDWKEFLKVGYTDKDQLKKDTKTDMNK